jgi:sterol O-acyltransferase
MLCRKSVLTYYSGWSTPLLANAPPSAQSIHSARKQVRAQQRQRLFPTIEYAARVSHFDPNSDYHNFRGFFVLFWIGLAIMVVTTMLRNIKETGHPMRVRIWSLFTTNVWELGLSDLAMVSSTAACLPIQILSRKSNGMLRWSKCGMLMQILYQVVWLTSWVA